MFLFSRMATLKGGFRGPVGWATEMRAKVDSLITPEVSLWAGRAGFALGTVAWNARVESRTELDDQMSRVLEDPGYHDLVERGQEFIIPPAQDVLRELIHPQDMPDQAPPVGSVATVITAVAAPGKLTDAFAWGPEIANLFSDATGVPALFYVDSYGAFGQFTWIAVTPDMQTCDEANAALANSSDYWKSIDDAGPMFVPGSGSQGLAVRIA